MKFSKAMKLANEGKPVRRSYWDRGFYIRYDRNDELFYFSHVDYSMENSWVPTMEQILSDDWELHEF